MKQEIQMTLTVTLPVYNAMPYLPAAVESILGQTYRDFEFLIIDDGSSDGSADYLRSLRDPRVKLSVRENRGLGATLNELFRNSQTEYVARMDADDICQPRRLEKQMAFLRDHRDMVMLGTGIDFMVGNSFVKGRLPGVEHSRIRLRLLQKRPGVYHPTIVAKRSAWAAVGGYRIAGAGEDVDFCLRLCDFGRVGNIPEALYHYRLHDNSISYKNRTELQEGYAFAVACARARELGMVEPEIMAFRAAWGRRSKWLRLGEFFTEAGQHLYRCSIDRRHQGRSVASYVYLLGAAICSPHVALSRLSSHL
jgi:glycosyltransferase involved in cell wall biosynthesis